MAMSLLALFSCLGRSCHYNLFPLQAMEYPETYCESGGIYELNVECVHDMSDAMSAIHCGLCKSRYSHDSCQDYEGQFSWAIDVRLIRKSHIRRTHPITSSLGAAPLHVRDQRSVTPQDLTYMIEYKCCGDVCRGHVRQTVEGKVWGPRICGCRLGSDAEMEAQRGNLIRVCNSSRLFTRLVLHP